MVSFPELRIYCTIIRDFMQVTWSHDRSLRDRSHMTVFSGPTGPKILLTQNQVIMPYPVPQNVFLRDRSANADRSHMTAPHKKTRPKRAASQTMLLQKGLVILQILPQKGRGIQPVGALFDAGTAVEAILDLGHVGLPGFGEPVGGGSPAKHQGHSGTVVDLNPHGAGHAIPTAPAEIPRQLLPVVFDQFLNFPGNGGFGFLEGQEFLQLLHFLDAPDGQDAGNFAR